MKIKFLTLNIEHGGVLFNKLLTFLKEENPDVIVLQEVQNSETSDTQKHHRTISYIQLAFPDYNLVYAPESLVKLNGLKVQHGNATLSRFPITTSSTTFFDIPYSEIDYEELKKNNAFEQVPHNILTTAVQIEAKSLTILNIHGIWGKDGNDNTRRLRMSETIIAQFKGKEHVILAGDFNVNPETRSISNIEVYLVNVFKGELTTTFNMKRKTDPGYATAVVDMIFVSPDIKVTNHYQPQVDVSDHLPLVVGLDV